MKKVLSFFIILFFFILFISFTTTYIVYSNYSFTTDSNEYLISNNEFAWPIPNYHKISSYFGYRISPTSGASKYHSGIDIPAPEGTNIYSSSAGKVIFLDFNGANGYTLMIENKNKIFSYSHISPKFIVNVGDTIFQSQLIANVVPKCIENIPNNPYIDSCGRQTNGATTGCHLHFSVKIDGKAIDPLKLFN